MSVGMCRVGVLALSLLWHTRSLSALPYNSQPKDATKSLHVEKKQSPMEQGHTIKRHQHGEKVSSPDSRQPANISAELLPDVSAVLQNSHRVFTEVGVQMAALQSQLVELQHQGADAIAIQKAEYEAKLQAQREEKAATKSMNGRITTAIEDLRRKNMGLRKRASDLAKASSSMRGEIEHMQENVTLAIEFMQQTLNLSEKLLNSTEVQVMAELAEEDALREKRLAHERLVQSVSMLQLQSEPMLKTDDMMHDLRSSLDDAAKETAASEATLKQVFERRFQAGEEELKSLHDLQVKLSTTMAGEKNLQRKLVGAVQHLEKVYAQLAQRRAAIIKFVQRAGLSPSINLTNASFSH